MKRVHNLICLLQEEQEEGISELWSSYKDGVLTCTFTHNLSTTSEVGGDLNLNGTSVYLLLAMGETIGEANIC